MALARHLTAKGYRGKKAKRKTYFYFYFYFFLLKRTRVSVLLSRILICIDFDHRGSDNGAPVNKNEDTCQQCASSKEPEACIKGFERHLLTVLTFFYWHFFTNSSCYVFGPKHPRAASESSKQPCNSQRNLIQNNKYWYRTNPNLFQRCSHVSQYGGSDGRPTVSDRPTGSPQF